MTFLCFTNNGAGTYTPNEVSTQAECLGYIVQQSSDFLSLSTLGTLFQQYFAFDDVLFEQLVGYQLLAFVSGHILGRIVGVMRKSF